MSPREIRARLLARQLDGRRFASLRALYEAAAAFGWTRPAITDAIDVLAESGDLREDLHGRLVVSERKSRRA